MNGKEQASEDAIIDATFSRERRAGAQLGLRVRALGIGLIAAALLLRVSGAALLYYFIFLGALLLTGWLFYETTNRRGRRIFGRRVTLAQAGLITADMALLTVAIVVPGPGTPEAWPDAMQLRLGGVGFLFVFLAFSALTYSPLLALWSGVAAGASWLFGVFWVLSQPGAFTRAPASFADMPTWEVIMTLLNPNYVSVIAAAQDALLLTIVGAVIAASVWRGRRQTLRQIESARERAKLARYFSPDVAAELTHRAIGVQERQTREAVIIFADIFGFTKMAEHMTPEDTIDFLREFHRRATGATFDHGGTLNKFIGDEVMISFGAIHDVANGPAAALACAIDIVNRVSAWSDERTARGESEVRVGVGLHIGEVVVGNIGDNRCLELAILGDVVNIASRLQQLTRDYDASIIASEEALLAATRAGFTEAARAFTISGGAEIRGRATPLSLAVMKRAP